MDINISSGDGSYLVREKAGRIAELRPGPDLDNVFFAGLETLDGGDRMWIAPEVELFYEGPPTEDLWRCPPELDPGNWSMESAGDTVELKQTALGARLSRRVSPLTDRAPAQDLRWAGYRVVSAVETSRRWSAWHLVMIPAPADIFVRADREPVVYYPPIPAISGGRMRADGMAPRWKVGFKPPSNGECALAALYDPDPGPLVVVTTRLDPDATYIDIPPSVQKQPAATSPASAETVFAHSAEGGEASAVQVFDSAGDGFCELEFHAPLESRRIESTVVAAWGPRAARMRVVNELARS